MPALQPYIIQPIWEQFEALLPERRTDHPLGCHRSRIPDKVVFEKLVETLGGLPDRASIHLDRGYDSGITRERLQERGLVAEISEKGKPAPLSAATKRWVIERTNSWH